MVNLTSDHDHGSTDRPFLFSLKNDTTAGHRSETLFSAAETRQEVTYKLILEQSLVSATRSLSQIGFKDWIAKSTGFFMPTTPGPHPVSSCFIPSSRHPVIPSSRHPVKNSKQPPDSAKNFNYKLDSTFVFILPAETGRFFAFPFSLCYDQIWNSDALVYSSYINDLTLVDGVSSGRIVRETNVEVVKDFDFF